MKPRFLRSAAVFVLPLLPLLALGLVGCGGAPGEDPLAVADEPAGGDSLAARNIPVTTGAAPGYVPDASCRLCHSEIYRSYQEVGMARSFFRPDPAKAIEDFAQGPYFHEPSQRYYRMTMEGGELRFRRYQLDDEGREVNVFEEKVDWVLGSGHTSRTYLYQNENGELYQLPLAWYTQGAHWAMAPGYDNPEHLGVLRAVRRECMFCHNAYPEVPAGSDEFLMPHVFPAQLPEGTGCQRCHGPGAEHLRTAFDQPGDGEAIRTSIVNPGRLTPELRNDVCNQCHLQPSVALFGLRRFGRGDYSYRPGEPLPEYALKVDVAEAGRDRSERFEINHHPYRLAQSPCFQESGGQLSCLTCHDPHRKVPPAQRAAHYRQACLSCHTLDSCQLEHMAAGGDWPTADPGDCASCHMPKHRTQDVIHVVMTDHLIRRTPPRKGELLAPLEEREAPILEDAQILEAARVSEDVELGIYRAIAVVRAGATAEAVKYLESNLQPDEFAQATPYLDLAEAQLLRRSYDKALATLDQVLARHPDSVRALSLRGIVLTSLGRRDEALAQLRQAAAMPGATPEIRFNLGRVLLGFGHPQEARETLEKTLAERPNFPFAHYHLAEALRQLGHRDEAIAHYRRALEIDPTLTRAYLSLGQALWEAGDHAATASLWRHGARVAKEKEALLRAMQENGIPTLSPAPTFPSPSGGQH